LHQSLNVAPDGAFFGTNVSVVDIGQHLNEYIIRRT